MNSDDNYHVGTFKDFVDTSVLRNDKSIHHICNKYVHIEFMGISDEQRNQLYSSVVRITNQQVDLGLNDSNVDDALTIACKYFSSTLIQKIVEKNHNFSQNMLIFCDTIQKFDFLLKNLYIYATKEVLRNHLIDTLIDLNRSSHGFYSANEIIEYIQIIETILNLIGSDISERTDEIKDSFWRITDSLPTHITNRLISMGHFDNDHEFMGKYFELCCESDDVEMVKLLMNSYGVKIDCNKFANVILPRSEGLKVLKLLSIDTKFKTQLDQLIINNWLTIFSSAIKHISDENYKVSNWLLDFLIHRNILTKNVILSISKNSPSPSPLFHMICDKCSEFGVNVAKIFNISKDDVNHTGMKLYAHCLGTGGLFFEYPSEKQEYSEKCDIININATWLVDNLGAFRINYV